MTFNAEEGSSLKDLADENENLQRYLECACSGNAQCSTCHVIVDPNYFDKLNPPEEAELDMIDLSLGVTNTSRLGCQLNLSKKCEGITFTIPEATNNLM
jgi:ferredoxin